MNKDRGSYKDAFQMNAAEKGMNYELTSNLMYQSTAQEQSLMQKSADLDFRNTAGLMADEHQYKMAGLQESGAQAIGLQGAVNEGMAAVEGIRSGAAQNIAGIQADAQRYGADQERLAALGVASTQAGAQRYGADRSLDAAKAQAFAERYVSEQQRKGAENVAYTQAGAARDIAATEGRTARDVASIQGGYGLQSIQEQQRGETERTGMSLSSQERQIGLTGQESRRTIETQGEQSRRNIETEGDQSRQNIRTTGDEERKTYSYQRDTDADRAVRMSRR
jgi:hypothetical protein